MTRRAAALIAALGLLSGCAHGLSGRQIYQADGVLVTLRVTGAESVAGELLVVDADSFVLDALGADGRPVRVVRVSRAAITEGAAYAGTSGGRWAVTHGAPPPGTRRVAEITSGGGLDGRLDLRLLSRFPHGLSDSLLATLLGRRGQTAVMPIPDTTTP